MKRFGIHILKLAVTITVILFCLNYIFDMGFQNSKYSQNKIQNILKKQNQHFDYIFLGSSRVLYSVNEKLIKGKKTLQLGMQGQSFQETVLTLKLLVENNISADYFFFQIDGDSGVENISSLGSYVFLPFSERHQIIKEHFLKNNYSSALFNIPYIKYMKNSHKIGIRGLISSVFFNREKSMGYAPLYKTINHFPSYYFTEEKLIKKEKITELLAYAKANKLNIQFFTAPYYKIDKPILFKNIAQQFNIINYSDSLKAKELYFDTYHLNTKGANIFTRMLIRDYKLNN